MQVSIGAGMNRGAFENVAHVFMFRVIHFVYGQLVMPFLLLLDILMYSFGNECGRYLEVR